MNNTTHELGYHAIGTLILKKYLFDHLHIPANTFENTGELELDIFRLQEYEGHLGNLETKIDGISLPPIVVMESTVFLYPYPYKIHRPSFEIQELEKIKPSKGCKMLNFPSKGDVFIDHIFMMTSNYFLDTIYPVNIPSLCITGIKNGKLTGVRGRLLSDFYTKDDIAFIPQAQLRVSKDLTLTQQVKAIKLGALDKFSYSLLRSDENSCAQDSHILSFNLPCEIQDQLEPYYKIPQNFKGLYCYFVQSFRISHVLKGIPREKVEGFVGVKLVNISGFLIWLNESFMERIHVN